MLKESEENLKNKKEISLSRLEEIGRLKQKVNSLQKTIHDMNKNNIEVVRSGPLQKLLDNGRDINGKELVEISTFELNTWC